MDNNIRQILQKQQNLEYLKKQNTLSQVKAKQTDNRLSAPYVQKILSYIKKLYFFNRMEWLRYRFSCILAIALLLLIPFCTIINNVQKQFSDLNYTSLFDQALDEGNTQEARQILEQKKVDPHSFAGALDYSSLYEKEGNYDEAVNVVLYFLTNVAGVQSLSESSPIYQRLVELKDYPLSHSVRSRYDAGIAACQENTIHLNAISDLIDIKNYEGALSICDQLKENCTSDNALFFDYKKCYMALEQYEKFADYLIILEKQALKEGDQYSYQIPDKYTLKTELQEIYDLVSDETRQQIDQLGVL